MSPTVSQAERWRPEGLSAVADTWDELARRIEAAATELSEPDRGAWTGSAAEKGWARLAESLRTATRLATAFAAAAAAARHGAAAIADARREVVQLVDRLRGGGYAVDDDGAVTVARVDFEMLSRAPYLTVAVRLALDVLGAADADTAAKIAEAFHGQAAVRRGTRPAGTGLVDPVSAWPSMSQDRIADQIAALSPDQRRRLIEAAPRQVGNTDGVPWDMRFAANRVNISDAILAQRHILERPEEDKVRDALGHGFGRGRGSPVDPAAVERLWATVLTDAGLRAAAVAHHDREANRRIEFYRSLLAQAPDATGRTARPVDRQILAFDPDRSSLIELHGDLRTATSVGVLVPGMNTTVLDSAPNAKTARRFVAAGRGEVAMITYLGGPFPAGDAVTGLASAAQSDHALAMAPRLVAFSEDVNRTVDATGRHISVTYLGHSYGGSILGTAERLGLTADRTVYIEAAGAGVGVHSTDDWHNRNPDVERFSMTAPGDPIEWVQGIPGGPHGADPDELPGVWRLGTGLRLDGTPMSGLAAHSDVLNEPSDAWRNLLAVITGRR